MDIERNKNLIARIIPAQRTMTAAQAFAGLQMPMLTATQANAWLTGSKENVVDEVRDPWA